MKYILIILLFISASGFSQTQVNYDSIINLCERYSDSLILDFTKKNLQVNNQLLYSESETTASILELAKECQKLTLEGLKLIRKQRLCRFQFREARRLKYSIEQYEMIINKN